MPTLIFKSIYSQVIIPVCVGVTIYLGFSPLMKFAPDGISKEFIIAGLGAIFVSYLTSILLQKQTVVEQENKKNEFIFAERHKIYIGAIDSLERILKDRKIKKEELLQLYFVFIRVQFLGEQNSSDEFQTLLKLLTDIHSKGPSIETKIDDKDIKKVMLAAYKLGRSCRADVMTAQLNDKSEEIGGLIAKSLGAREAISDDSFYQLKNTMPQVKDGVENFIQRILQVDKDLIKKYAKSEISISNQNSQKKAKSILFCKVNKTSANLIFAGQSTSEAENLNKIAKMVNGQVTLYKQNLLTIKLNLPLTLNEKDFDNLAKAVKLFKDRYT